MKTLIIADIGNSHNGSTSKARCLIDEAKKCGCGAIKFQTYSADKLVTQDNDKYSMLKKCELSYMQQKGLKEYADDVGIEFLSTPFDEESLRFLIEDLGLRKIKISSFDATNTKLLDAVNEYGKRYPDIEILVSVGMTNAWEVQQAADCFKYVPYLTMMHCVSAYPVPQQEVNLEAIRSLQRLIGSHRYVGYSDHTNSILIPASAVLVGATVIQKHFKIDENCIKEEAAIAADPKMMKAMVNLIRAYEDILGNGELKAKESEKEMMQFRRKS